VLSKTKSARACTDARTPQVSQRLREYFAEKALKNPRDGREILLDEPLQKASANPFNNRRHAHARTRARTHT
jgi:hypothetical protein